MLRLLLGISVGYVFGTKAGRARYEQLSKAYRNVKASPATQKILAASRDKLAESISTTKKLEPIEITTPGGEDGTIMVPHGTVH